MIFIARDDINVSFPTSKKYIESINNTNGIAYIREMPSGRGAHHAVDHTTNGWFETFDIFTTKLSSLNDGLYYVGFYDDPHWYQVTNHEYEEVSSDADIAPKTDVVTSLGIECKSVSLAWVEAVRFFREF